MWFDAFARSAPFGIKVNYQSIFGLVVLEGFEMFLSGDLVNVSSGGHDGMESVWRRLNNGWLELRWDG